MTDRTTTVRRLFDEVWNKGNLNLADEIIAPDHINDDPVNASRGLDAMKGTVTKYRRAFPDVRFQVDEILTAGDNVVARWRYSGTHANELDGIPSTGRRVTGQGISVHRFKGDRIEETHVVWDALGMMQQLGVVTLPGKSFKVGL
jgi:steroid delta-isomerase-like uncharacterized protein